MGKNKFKILSIIISILMLFSVSACDYAVNGNGGAQPQTEYCTVTLIYNNGYSPYTTSVEKGTTFSTPKDPYKNNYIFEGWYTESSFIYKYDFSTPVTENITLHAKFTLNGTAITNKISTDLIKGVVKVYNKSYNTFLGFTTSWEEGQGSGFCFYAGGGKYYILTNCHVAKKKSGYDKQELTVEDYQGNQYKAKIFYGKDKPSSAIDNTYDLACLYFETSSTNIKALTMANVNPGIAEDVITLGAPKGQTNSITIGKTKSYNTITLTDPTYLSDVTFPVITYLAPSNNSTSGTSGGPLLNANLLVVGVHYAGSSSSNTKYAIPIEKVREFLNKYVYA